MSLLLHSDALASRGTAMRGELEMLAVSLRRDLQRVMDAGISIPTAKALLSRDGGRCAQHGAALEFDPYSPREHRCPVGGELHHGERHYRWWITYYQLWLAERAVHAAALHALCEDAAAGALARTILQGYSEQYLRYPNRDNVLGPTRPFFSTYLESIWLLQLCVALDLLEMRGAGDGVGALVRERIIEPSRNLIASFGEHLSNRQVWNNAAIIAASTLLGESDRAARAITGSAGLLEHLTHGLLPDGTWYEGENYHFFAHRGLWYGVVMSDALGVDIPGPLRQRFSEAFATPLLTALPDFTFPARRDSQYAISLRQWRFAESCELGLARDDDIRLRGALWELYEHAPVPRGDTGRWRSTAESERNEPATALSRADLGWRSLLFARDALPVLAPVPAHSALLAAQGLAVLRRDAGRVYLALDYGHSGGGHGHPDRLNMLMAVGNERWLDDMGTGAYVDPTLFWYRSTLAHNAPLVNGHSQAPVDGVLRAYDERGGAGWVDAEVPEGGIAPGVRVRRSLVAMVGYVVDRVEWHAAQGTCFGLPVHTDAMLDGAGPPAAGVIGGGAARDDGFAYVSDATAAPAGRGATVRLSHGDRVRAWAVSDGESEWWRMLGPGAPGGAPRHFLMVRARGTAGVLHTVWNWAAPIARVRGAGAALMVEMGRGERHEHVLRGMEWHIALVSGGRRSSIVLRGARSLAQSLGGIAASPPEPKPVVLPRAPHSPLAFELGANAYRMSEEGWRDAGCPTATVVLGVEADELIVTVDVQKPAVVFRPADAPDPALDNDPPDIHSDGVQLYLAAHGWTQPAGWLAVPATGGGMRVHHVEGMRGETPCEASWERTPTGYRARFAIPLSALGAAIREPLGLEVVVNDMAAGRARRRGQLVLSGAAGGTVYLRGDREEATRFRRFLIPDD